MTHQKDTEIHELQNEIQRLKSLVRRRIVYEHGYLEENPGDGMYIHCNKCVNELPPGKSPREWTRLEFSLMPDGSMLLWCVRHDMCVSHITATLMDMAPGPDIRDECGAETMSTDGTH